MGFDSTHEEAHQVGWDEYQPCLLDMSPRDNGGNVDALRNVLSPLNDEGIPQ